MTEEQIKAAIARGADRRSSEHPRKPPFHVGGWKSEPDGVPPLLAAGDDVLHEVCLMDLLMTGEHAGKEGSPG